MELIYPDKEIIREIELMMMTQWWVHGRLSAKCGLANHQASGCYDSDIWKSTEVWIENILIFSFKINDLKPTTGYGCAVALYVTTSWSGDWGRLLASSKAAWRRWRSPAVTTRWTRDSRFIGTARDTLVAPSSGHPMAMTRQEKYFPTL